ncbi:MAG: Fur family transcriptional regulator [Anaerolineales bacterium]
MTLKPLLNHTNTRLMLKSHGLRATPQRLLVFQILEEADDHLDAEDIWGYGQDYDPSLSLATVYRTLNVLKKVGLVEQRYFARDHKREYYEPSQKEEHYHFTCLGCGRVIEIQTPRITQARRELTEQLGLDVTHACICFEGYCQNCAN